MAEIVNLRAFKKARTKTEARAQADANAAKFGRRKGDRLAEDAAREKAKRDLDGHALEPKDTP